MLQCRRTQAETTAEVIKSDSELMCTAVNSDVWVGYARGC